MRSDCARRRIETLYGRVPLTTASTDHGSPVSRVTAPLMKYARPFARLPPGTSGARRRVNVDRWTVGIGFSIVAARSGRVSGRGFPYNSEQWAADGHHDY